MGVMGPREVTYDAVCNFEYHERDGATNVPSVLCPCGTYAIGHCASCGSPICGTHSALRDGRRLCGDHVRTHDASSKRRAAKVAEDAILAEWALLLDRFEHTVARYSDPLERFICAVAVRVSSPAMGEFLAGRTWPVQPADATEAQRIRQVLLAELGGRCKALIPTSRTAVYDASPADPSKWTFRGRELMEWASRRHKELPTRIKVVGTSGRGKWAGWYLTSGSADGGYRESTYHFDKYVLASGKSILVPKGKRKTWSAPGELTAEDLTDIAGLCSITFKPVK